MATIQQKRFLSDEQCKASAAHIAAEFVRYAAGTPGQCDIWTQENFDGKAQRLYHPGEVTTIRAILVETGALSA